MLTQEFKLDGDAEIDGTSRKGEITTTYSKLAQLFGEAQESDGYKCSGQWVFVSGEGDVFTVYDWKETELYDSGLPSVKKFRESKEPSTFNVGGRYGSDYVSFINWLRKKIS